jgi:hypothetical protein
MGKHNRKSKKKLLKESLRLPALAIENNTSRRNALYILDRFSTYCYDNGIRDKTEIDVEFINEYSRYLQNENYTASTIHTYLVFVCKSCGVKLDLIDKPMRRTSEYTKGREAKEEPRSDMDPDNPRWQKVWEISRATGLRREELRKLRIGDFTYTVSFLFGTMIKVCVWENLGAYPHSESAEVISVKNGIAKLQGAGIVNFTFLKDGKTYDKTVDFTNSPVCEIEI